MTKLLALLVTVGALGGQAQSWHSLTKLTPTQRQSASYKFLVSKFGAGHLLFECDPEGASEMGGEYLIQVMDDGKPERDGETIGHGATLQEALNDAAASYLSAATVRRLDAEYAQEQRDQKQREIEYRKKCCKEQP